MANYCDIHTHLTHEKFTSDRAEVIQRAINAGLQAIVVNGLEPKSNREILSLASQIPQVKPALGIYPIDAVNEMLKEGLPFRIEKFDVGEELLFIDQVAASGKLLAIGECGLDGHWIGEETFARQEEVFEQLIEIAKKNALPLIIHTRKREQRAAEILRHHNVSRVNFHCFGGRSKWAQQWAEKYGWWFSIPANARKSEAFTKMLRTLPPERILTETDAPYLAPNRGDRNEPANVVGTISYLAELRGWSEGEAKSRVWQNYEALVSNRK